MIFACKKDCLQEMCESRGYCPLIGSYSVKLNSLWTQEYILWYIENIIMIPDFEEYHD